MASNSRAVGAVTDLAPSSEANYLSKIFLESDELCATSTSIHRLLQRIWKYSSTAQAPDMTSIELAAGQRYWLPDGSLADEWIHFFQIVPNRFLDMAPPKLKVAFENQVGDNSTVGASFEDAMGELAVQESQTPDFEDILPPLERVSTQESLEVTGELMPPVLSPIPTPLVSSRKRTYDVSSESSSVATPHPKRARHHDATVATTQRVTAGQPFSSAVDPSLPLVTVQGSRFTQIVPATNTGPLDVQAAPTTQPVLTTAPLLLVNSARVTFLLLSSPDGRVDFLEDPTTPQQFLQQHGFRPIMTLPGALLPTGNQNKAWHAQRLRAWVEIEGKRLNQLPHTALSIYGNEMSNLRTPESIDPRLCPFSTSIEENFTYFPNTCTINREMCIRAKYQWSAVNIARYINYAHNVQTYGVVSRSRIAYHFAEANRFVASNTGIVPTASLQNIRTDSGLLGDNSNLHDYFLYHMGDGVRHPPTGRQAQMLTRVIEHVRNVTQDTNVRLSEASQYAERYGISVPVSDRMNFANSAMEDRPLRAILDTINNDFRRKFARPP